jgi:hypothetical protein
MNISQWVYRIDKTPKYNYGKVKKIIVMTNGKKDIRVDSLYTDKKLGINKRKGYKRR